MVDESRFHHDLWGPRIESLRGKLNFPYEIAVGQPFSAVKKMFRNSGILQLHQLKYYSLGTGNQALPEHDPASHHSQGKPPICAAYQDLQGLRQYVLIEVKQAMHPLNMPMHAAQVSLAFEHTHAHRWNKDDLELPNGHSG